MPDPTTDLDAYLRAVGAAALRDFQARFDLRADIQRLALEEPQGGEPSSGIPGKAKRIDTWDSSESSPPETNSRSDGASAPGEPHDAAELTHEHDWYRTAARPSEVEAACALADVLAIIGDPAAQRWYQVAAQADHRRAHQALERLAITWATQLERAFVS